jgi:hypothetical protein
MADAAGFGLKHRPTACGDRAIRIGVRFLIRITEDDGSVLTDNAVRRFDPLA